VTVPPVSSQEPTSLASAALAGEQPAAPATERTRGPLNLARQPFLNARPVTRIAILLWIGAGLLLASNVALFWSYLARSEKTRTALGAAEQGTEHEKQAVQDLDSRLASLNVDRQNREVLYLNRKIAERVFSWSHLFDRLAEVLPDGVRLVHLLPERLGGKEDINVNQRQAKNDVTLEISGEAKSDEVLLQFVDRLFAHASFSEPDLLRQERGEDGLILFELKVHYLPDVPLLPPAPAPAARITRPAAKTLPQVVHRPSGGRP
jgi:Tfp pilus assembly protein PilN